MRNMNADFIQAGSELLTDGIVDRLAELLSSDRAEQAAEIIAEMAKSEDNRIIMVQQAVRFIMHII